MVLAKLPGCPAEALKEKRGERPFADVRGRVLDVRSASRQTLPVAGYGGYSVVGMVMTRGGAREIRGCAEKQPAVGGPSLPADFDGGAAAQALRLGGSQRRGEK